MRLLVPKECFLSEWCVSSLEYRDVLFTYLQAMSKAREEHNRGPANPQLNSEYNLWEEHWIK